MNKQQLLNWVFSAYPNGHTEAVPATIHEANRNYNQVKWIPPASGSICVNCDAAVVDNTPGVGIDFIWRRADGHLISAGMSYLHSCCSPKMAEAWALWEALNNLPATEISHFEIQSDCRMLVEEITSKNRSLTADSTIIHKIKTLLENFTHVNIIHVKRTNNECANLLARKCLADKNSFSFYNSFPDWLVKFCKADHPFEL
ncbi:hypothetical protein F8388_005741 [Cannabis sativa]|uniref:RNase H type-1 domain-containing protein n=1 Tax=Cannabis sativa TaxID=3483 RepID=A0A7J6HNI4_CANSA|nr:hypothetical protein F8388_005741 [Cannabis sativa]